MVELWDWKLFILRFDTSDMNSLVVLEVNSRQTELQRCLSYLIDLMAELYSCLYVISN